MDEKKITEEVVEQVEEAPAEKPKTAKQPKQPAKGVAGNYKTTCLLNLREAADVSANVVCVLPAGSKVACDGKVVKNNDVEWYSVKAEINGASVPGFCMSKYLSK